MDKPYENLAKNLFAAWVADHMRISIGYAYKAYVPDDVGPFWYELARIVTEDQMRVIDRALRGVSGTERITH